MMAAVMNGWTDAPRNVERDSDADEQHEVLREAAGELAEVLADPRQLAEDVEDHAARHARGEPGDDEHDNGDDDFRAGDVGVGDEIRDVALGDDRDRSRRGCPPATHEIGCSNLSRLQCAPGSSCLRESAARDPRASPLQGDSTADDVASFCRRSITGHVAV